MKRTRQVVRKRRVRYKSRGWRLQNVRYPEEPGYAVVVLARYWSDGSLYFVVRVR